MNLEHETLQKQFLVVRNETNTSHVQEFGDRSLRRLPVADFLGEAEPESKIKLEKIEVRMANYNFSVFILALLVPI